MGAAEALSGPAEGAVGVLWSCVVAVAGAGACVGVGVVEGSADSSAPVMDWKSASSLAEVMVKGCRRMGAALVACWVQCAANGCAVGGGECLDSCEARESNEVRDPERGAQSLDGAAAAGVRCRRRRTVACGRWVHWQEMCVRDHGSSAVSSVMNSQVPAVRESWLRPADASEGISRAGQRRNRHHSGRASASSSQACASKHGT
jgi:hypothetical protein